MPIEYLPFIFFFIALFYSSVGFGGGSSYLAILSLVLTDFYEIRSTALILNICVVTIGTIVYMKHGVLKPKLLWPFFVLSIPMAYLGALVKLSQDSFFLVLGCALLLAGIFMLLKLVQSRLESVEFSNPKKLLLGGSIGLLSGISGIGGGIFLSPVLNLLKWENPRIIAALASVFILVNSLAGLVGLNVAGTFRLDYDLVFNLIIAVVLGGSLGSYLSNKKFNLKILGILTAILVFYVGLRLILLHGFGIKI
ncbi:sulfite exporter TauE/SafE family protein [Subsaximicrobium wynnwilliamsii]|uniref:Probable membrane transporter protein n=1 Tax=Subsaximicrobium wynnwilliamsii TaxID=291179 RepID=A0A5C6ZGF3_9FLAO|nr:sulfite exporter TauE/SafE family protein [Subsaximicrobium wynnwilliamsii]TXD83174.1 sulfite exporter TauE/SafE family protein [Subsaximicrobium wynnwilliamsii]TXD88287.1 sulfite exporter TauE/SafE family protein [Subsaximicrobium wynnwilliamsii]TXE03008.1 sulfite exporter TauE/SafE family protein [Subsaximicrobium wynnwilliamsii]